MTSRWKVVAKPPSNLLRYVFGSPPQYSGIEVFIGWIDMYNN